MMVKRLRPWGPDSNPGAADEAGAVQVSVGAAVTGAVQGAAQQLEDTFGQEQFNAQEQWMNVADYSVITLQSFVAAETFAFIATGDGADYDPGNPSKPARIATSALFNHRTGEVEGSVTRSGETTIDLGTIGIGPLHGGMAASDLVLTGTEDPFAYASENPRSGTISIGHSGSIPIDELTGGFITMEAPPISVHVNIERPAENNRMRVSRAQGTEFPSHAATSQRALSTDANVFWRYDTTMDVHTGPFRGLWRVEELPR